MEIGNAATANASGNTLYLKCENETDVSTQQTGGNGLEVWGDTSTLGLDVKYMKVTNAEGRAFDGSDTYSGQNLSGITVEYGRATNVNQNTALNEPSPALPWFPETGPVYQDVQPAP